MTDTGDRLFEEAARWHIRLRDPDAPARVHDAFLDWIRQDPRHLAAYDRAEALWQAMEPPAPARDEAAISALVAQGRGRKGRGLVCLALAVGLGLWQGPDAWDSLRADHVARTGSRDSIVLEEGSRIDLNSGSAIAVAFGPGERRVRMFRGEAFFDVAHDAARPFVVDMPEGSLRVTGTRFNVDLAGEAAEVALLEGRVTLSARDAPGTTALAPGQQAAVRPSGVGDPAPFDAESRTAWRGGRMIFYRTPLREVIAELGRYRRGAVLLLNDGAAELPVTGAFSTEDPDQVIDIIAETMGLSVHRVPGALTVLR
ncbi:FecR family protein [Paenirhodobacter sp.]|uniref:FecR family protein n=1 Tax=Paenirhodobacter sp. TaxID=1965326 RepID=UPI003B3F7604